MEKYKQPMKSKKTYVEILALYVSEFHFPKIVIFLDKRKSRTAEVSLSV